MTTHAPPIPPPPAPPLAPSVSDLARRVKNMAILLADEGVSDHEFAKHFTWLLFLKLAHELAEGPAGAVVIPSDRDKDGDVACDWPSLRGLDGPDLVAHYRRVLRFLGAQPGLLGLIFKDADCKIGKPTTLRRLVQLIDSEDWASMDVDVKGVVYEELLDRAAKEVGKGAGQYFTPRAVTGAIVDVMRPGPTDTIIDPAAGAGGFLTAAYGHVVAQPGLDRDQLRRARESLVTAQELVPATARLCAMNLLLHGITGGASPVVTSGSSSIATAPARRYSMVLTNPPFGVARAGGASGHGGASDADEIARQDFWVKTKSKQLNFVQHVYTLLKAGGRAAVIVPDNVLSSKQGRRVRQRLLRECNVHTLLRLPAGIFFSKSTLASVLFFDRLPPRSGIATKQLWVYDLRTGMDFSPKKRPIRREDLDEFVAVYRAEEISKRTPTWSPETPRGRWRSYSYEELQARGLNLDLSWIRQEVDTSSVSELVAEVEAALDGARDAIGRLTAPPDAITQSPAERDGCVQPELDPSDGTGIARTIAREGWVKGPPNR